MVATAYANLGIEDVMLFDDLLAEVLRRDADLEWSGQAIVMLVNAFSKVHSAAEVQASGRAFQQVSEGRREGMTEVGNSDGRRDFWERAARFLVSFGEFEEVASLQQILNGFSKVAGHECGREAANMIFAHFSKKLLEERARHDEHGHLMVRRAAPLKKGGGSEKETALAALSIQDCTVLLNAYRRYFAGVQRGSGGGDSSGLPDEETLNYVVLLLRARIADPSDTDLDALGASAIIAVSNSYAVRGDAAQELLTLFDRKLEREPTFLGKFGPYALSQGLGNLARIRECVKRDLARMVLVATADLENVSSSSKAEDASGELDETDHGAAPRLRSDEDVRSPPRQKDEEDIGDKVATCARLTRLGAAFAKQIVLYLQVVERKAGRRNSVSEMSEFSARDLACIVSSLGKLKIQSKMLVYLLSGLIKERCEGGQLSGQAIGMLLQGLARMSAGERARASTSTSGTPGAAGVAKGVPHADPHSNQQDSEETHGPPTTVEQEVAPQQQQPLDAPAPRKKDVVLQRLVFVLKRQVRRELGSYNAMEISVIAHALYQLQNFDQALSSRFEARLEELRGDTTSEGEDRDDTTSGKMAPAGMEGEEPSSNISAASSLRMEHLLRRGRRGRRGRLVSPNRDLSEEEAGTSECGTSGGVPDEELLVAAGDELLSSGTKDAGLQESAVARSPAERSGERNSEGANVSSTASASSIKWQRLQVDSGGLGGAGVEATPADGEGIGGMLERRRLRREQADRQLNDEPHGRPRRGLESQTRSTEFEAFGVGATDGFATLSEEEEHARQEQSEWAPPPRKSRAGRKSRHVS